MVTYTIGSTIKRVQYYDINAPNPRYFYEGFDAFDLGICIEFTNGKQWYLGWNEHDRFESNVGPYFPEDLFPSFQYTDATERWRNYLTTTVKNITIHHDTAHWLHIRSCVLNFENGERITIQLGDEMETPDTLPKPDSFQADSMIYVCFEKNPPEVKPEFLAIPPVPSYTRTGPEGEQLKSISSTRVAGFLIVVVVLVISFLLFAMRFLDANYG